MSAPLAGPEDIAQVRDLEVREYMEQMDPEDHLVSSFKPVYDSRNSRWFQPQNNMLFVFPFLNRQCIRPNACLGI